MILHSAGRVADNVELFEHFKKEMVRLHPHLDFTKGIYLNKSVKIEYNCTIHNKVFEARPSNLLKGQGCPKCGRESTNRMNSTLASSFIPRATELHGGKYDYSDTKCVNSYTKVRILCNTCGNHFMQIPYSHLEGKGCPICSKSGFDPSKPAILYYLKVETMNQLAYKVGITNLTIRERMTKTDFNNVSFIYQEHFPHGQDAYDKEQAILKEFKEFQYKGDPILESGNTELFFKDILNLDKIHEVIVQ